MDDRFEQMRAKRKAAAEALLKKEKVEEAEDVWDFFETLGFMVRRKAVDEELVWHTFFHWRDGYWNASRTHIAAYQATYPTAYVDFKNLHEQTLAIERGKLEKTGRNYQIYPVEKFLKEEAELEED